MKSPKKEDSAEKDAFVRAANALLLELKARNPKGISLVSAINPSDIEPQPDTGGWAIALGYSAGDTICLALWYDRFLGMGDRCFWTGFEFDDPNELKKFVDTELVATRLSSSDVQKGKVEHVKPGAVPNAERFPAIESFGATDFHGYGVYDRGLSSENEGTRLDVSRAASFVVDATARVFRTDFEEGACGQVTRVVRERDPAARVACLRHHKKPYKCVVCDLSFEKIYGPRGKDFIHVHHIEPLGKVGRKVRNSEKDLVPVCPNCHAMLHRKPLMTPTQLRKLMEEISDKR